MKETPLSVHRRPELLAPAGDFECARAAVENGADSVYFGLRSGFSARARAVNFVSEELPDLTDYLHRRAARGYLTLNTLVFPGELETLEHTVRMAIAAGVDAVLVQDLGAARLIRALAADWPIHASTQMSLTSAEGIRAARSLGIRRVVLARELSLDEIRQIRAETDVELEVFVHGALCISYSGQCMASLAMGGRSGNRGQCAQACRLPYELLREGRLVELGDRRYLLSPQDLATYDLIPDLVDAGVDAMKIEGRLKSAEYVAAATRLYRRAIDQAVAGQPLRLASEELDELEVAFSRGFSHGWLRGHDDRVLVPGQSSAKRGIVVGEVQAVRGDRVTVSLSGSIKRGDGVVFASDGDNPQGGRVYEVFRGRESVKEAISSELVDLCFAYDSIDFDQLRAGQKLWKTDDPQLARRLRKTFASGRPNRRVPLDLTVEAGVGRVLRITARAESGATCEIASPEVLEKAIQHPLTEETLRKQLGRLGSTIYELRQLDARIHGRPMVPLSVLGQLRQQLIQQLDACVGARPVYTVAEQSPLAGTPVADPQEAPVGGQISWHVLCRSLEDLEEALAIGPASVTADFAELSQYRDAVRQARRSGVAIFLATPRIQKPGEAAIFQKMADCEPDGMLVRNLAGVAFCRDEKLAFVADSSLNAANSWTVDYLQELGAQRVAAAYDMDGPRLLDLAATIRGPWLEVVVYQHLPLFHTEHCIFCGAKIAGANRTACGRPCCRSDLRLRDRYGVEHRLRADACCRNTLFHAQPRTLLDLMPQLRRSGVRHFRIELLDGVAHESLARLMGRK